MERRARFPSPGRDALCAATLRRDPSEVVIVRSPAAAFGMLSVLTFGYALAASCGGQASAARAVPGAPPLAAVEPAAGTAASGAIRADTGGAIEVTDAQSPLAGARIELPPGALSANATVAIDAGVEGALAMFPDLTIVRATPAAGLLTPARVRIPYSDAFLARWSIGDERQLVLYTLDDDGLWGALVASVDPSRNVVEANVDRLTSWVVAPGWMLTSWQRRALIGDAFEPSKRNVLLLHGWNSSPWDGCELQLAAAMRGSYDHVLAYAYPSALDIASNAVWLRDELAARYAGATFDVVGFSEGGLIARAAVEPGAWNGGRTMAASVRNLITIAAPHLGMLDSVAPSLLGDVATDDMRAGSPFLRALNERPVTGSVRYGAIAGAGWRDGASDGLVSVESALAHGVLPTARTATLPLVHASAFGGAGMPCDARAYETIRAWAR